MRILCKTPNDRWREADIGNTLDDITGALGGAVKTIRLKSDLLLACTEEGLKEQLPFNTRLMGLNLHGPVLIMGVHDGKYQDCPASITEWRTYWTGGVD